MPKGVRIKYNPGALDRLLGELALPLVKQAGEAIAEACNNDSTWGGYHTSATVDADRARATVWSADNRNDESRDQRLVRNLDAGA